QATIKIGSLLIKTLAKPIAKSIQNQNHPRFKRFCINLTPFFHEKIFDYKVTAIRPLNEAKAVELGASFISESLLFGVAGFTIVFETWRNSRKATNRVHNVDEAIARLEAERILDSEALGVISNEVASLRNETESLRKAVVALSSIVEEPEATPPASAGWFTGSVRRSPLISSHRHQELREALEESRILSESIRALEQKMEARPPASIAANTVETGL
ncbi:optic atrophy 3 protein-domain-containing protein, partial [Chytridium lagenaria]